MNIQHYFRATAAKRAFAAILMLGMVAANFPALALAQVGEDPSVDTLTTQTEITDLPTHDAPAPTCTLTASHNSITLGDSVTLTLASTDAVSVTIDPGGHTPNVNGGTIEVSPTEDTTYTATVVGSDEQQGTCHTTVTVHAPTTPPTPQHTVTLSAAKVVCSDPEDMPRWGGGGPDITGSTAADWVASHESCHLSNDWHFQWGNENAGDGGNATVGPVANYNSFGPTLHGYATTTINISDLTGSRIEAREVLKDGYIPFSSEGPSAEFYCSSDVLNYDNWEWIPGPFHAGDIYHCVAFNMATPHDGGDNGGGGNDHPGATLTIIKNTSGGDGQFTFNVTAGESLATSTQISTSGSSSTTEGTGQQAVHLHAGPYDVTEAVPDGWTLDEVSCAYDSESIGTTITNGEHIVINDGDDVTCTFSNTKDVTPQEETPTTDGGGGHHHHSGSGGQVLGASTGEVLGNTCPLLTQYMRQGLNNDPAQVTLLQTFLNGELGLSLPVTGIFDTNTTNAVNTFQLKYQPDVLAPWAPFGYSPTKPTGYVFKTTEWKINSIACPDLNAPFPQLP